MTITPLRCGSLDWPAADLLPGALGRIPLIVWSFVVTHPDGVVLFDTGLHPSWRDDPAARLGGLGDHFGVELGPGADVAGRLAAAGIDAAAVDIVVASHLHWDHCGGNALASEARVMVQRREWEHANRDSVDPGGYVRADYDTGQPVVLVDGEHDVFGDGLVMCVPTYGHTPGHQSLRVRLAGGEVLLAADACLLRRHLEAGHGASFDHDPVAQRAAMAGLARARAAGAILVCGHDELDGVAAAALEPEPPTAEPPAPERPSLS